MGDRDANELREAWAALRRADWQLARAGFAAQLERDPDDAEALDGLGRAIWWTGARAEATARRREAYALFSRRGDARAAANIAIYLAAEHRVEGEPEAAAGWIERAAKLVDSAQATAERGWLEVERAKRAAAEPEARARHATAATELAHQLGDADLEAAALAQLGLARVDAGAIEPGWTLLDEAMAVATTDASDPSAIGDACEATLQACERLADLARAADWCRVVVEFTGRRGYTPLHLWARTVYAGVLTKTGDWERSERELSWALRGYDALGDGERSFAVGGLAELRVRQGRLAEARVLLRGHEREWRTATAATTLALADGDIKRAAALVRHRTEAAGSDDAQLAGVLAQALALKLATGDLDGAREEVAQLRELGERLSRPDLLAFAHHGEASVAAARGDERHALAGFELALAAFGRLRMPLEEARSRLALARLESGELALLHARTALAIFERLGALADADAAGSAMRSLGSGGPTAPRITGELTAREREVLELLGEGLTNQAIAERLVISPRTAEHHVGRILGKLGLRRRAEAAAFAVRESYER
jgi:DNA-binding NarL/FixJ family response regulator